MTTQNFASWLRSQLSDRNWKQADLVRESENRIKADRASKWANGHETPSYRFAIVLANTLGLPHDVVLEAAGFEKELPESAEERENKLAEAVRAIPSIARARNLEDYADSELLAELRTRALRREAITRSSNVTPLHADDDLEDSGIEMTEEEELRYAADDSDHDEVFD